MDGFGPNRNIAASKKDERLEPWRVQRVSDEGGVRIDRIVVVVVAAADVVVVMALVGRGKAEGGQGGAVRALIGYTRLVCVEGQEWG